MTTQKQPISGSVDESFGDKGIATLIFPENRLEIVFGMTLTPEARILAVGVTSLNVTPDGYHFIVGCLSENGVVDLSFGRNGTIIGRFKDHASIGVSVHVLKDGKILVTGRVNAYEQSLPAVTRLFANGEVDRAFAEDGTFVFPAQSQPADETATVSPPLNHSRSTEGTGSQATVLKDGKIILSLSTARDYQGLLVRLTADGHLDTSFNGTGYIRVRAPLPDTLATYIKAFRVTPTGKIVICGHAVTSSGQRGLLARYGVDGHPDSSFGNDGFFILEGPDSTTVDDVIEHEKGNSVAFGGARDQSNEAAAIAFGVTVDGSIDFGFNNGKISRLDLPRTEWYSAAKTPLSESMVVTGLNYEWDNGTTDVIVGRYLKAGYLDRDFGNGHGWTILNLGMEARVALQTSGKILISYNEPIQNNLPGFGAITRLLP